MKHKPDDCDMKEEATEFDFKPPYCDDCLDAQVEKVIRQVEAKEKRDTEKPRPDRVDLPFYLRADMSYGFYD